ncbi:2OG-Fe(II) oxygenase [Methylomonas fluvii]|uniref:2OG-Fe(II) oxygenase n=1 Tax=Methylomonas fluvii TaxID=1854564 RepID=A0ABR9DHA9_9GAMM|nr:2OG-Fe(II) oxygenase [Methylomonas fluvii]MBD9362462.1 2OG-Fe(II) oxygenase [Methylomonas fluvii]
MKAKEASNLFDRIPPYCIVQDFLGNDLVERLLDHAIVREAEFAPTKIGNYAGQRLDPEFRLSQVLRDFCGLRPELEARFEDVMARAVDGLRLAPFDLARCEIEIVAHNDGAFFKRHIDTATEYPDEKTQRVLTGVLYFHALPKNFGGGQLRLYSFVGEGFVDIEPERDKLVLFPAWVPHEVLPVSCPSGEFAKSRFSINCWYRRSRLQK